MQDTRNTEEFLLNLYKHCVDCYHQLHCRLQVPHLAKDSSMIGFLVEKCSESIKALLRLDWELKNEESDSNLNIQHSLLILSEQLTEFSNTLKTSNLRTGSSTNANDEDALTLFSTTPQREVSNAVGVTSPRVKGLQNVAGLKETKKLLATIILLPIRQPQLYVGEKIANSVLLFGPPGTGKTRLAHAIAAEASASFFCIKSSDILSKYVGGSEKATNAIFATVKKEKGCSILFMDEIDGLCQRRHSQENEWSRRMKTELMTQLSNFEDFPNKYLICATNCPWDLDLAIFRRFQRRIYVPLPNKEERLELLKLFSKNTPLENCNLWEVVVDMTEGYSGSDLADILRNARNVPITELFDTCFWKSIGDNKYMPSDFSSNDDIECKFEEMPPGSVHARPVNVYDIISTLETIKPTVPKTEVLKYEEFLKPQ